MPNSIRIDYVFKFSDGRERRFNTELDSDTMAIANKSVEPLPDWTLLSFHQCAGCPLSPATHQRCPVAVNLVEVAEFFKACFSYEEVDVTVISDSRTCNRHTTVEEGLASLLEVYLAAGGCPVMDKMRPALNHYMPFATPAEATYRFLALYLAGQFFLPRAGKPADWSTEHLREFLNEMQQVEAAFLQRLKAIDEKDALRNAMVVLSNLVSLAARAVSVNKLQRLETIFLSAWK